MFDTDVCSCLMRGASPEFDLPEAAAAHYADIRADLRRRGSMIGANDLIIAAHARCLDLVLVTHNVAEFGRVEGLSAENWVEPEA